MKTMTLPQFPTKVRSVKKPDRTCKACGKPKRNCVLPCRLAVSAFTEDERLVSWLKHVYLRLNAESDRLDPEWKHPSGTVACLGNATKNLATAIFYISGNHVSEVK